MQNRFGLLDTDVMPIFIIIALDIVITLHFSINCSVVICSPIVIISILREASSEIYGPRVYFTSYQFPIHIFSFLFLLLCNLDFPFHIPKMPKILLYRLSSLSDLTLQITVKGLTTPYVTGNHGYLWDQEAPCWFSRGRRIAQRADERGAAQHVITQAIYPGSGRREA